MGTLPALPLEFGVPRTVDIRGRLFSGGWCPGRCGLRGDVWREEVPGSWGKGGQRQAGKPGAQQHLSKNQEHMCVVRLACQGI